MNRFSSRHRFADWPNGAVPKIGAGVYVVWDAEVLIYCGMSGRSMESIDLASRKRYGLITRLESHASGRLSGDQFCVYVANRLVIPSLVPEQLQKFASGELTLDVLTRSYIRERLEYQYACVKSSKEAYDLERQCRAGEIFGKRPVLNPIDKIFWSSERTMIQPRRPKATPAAERS